MLTKIPSVRESGLLDMAPSRPQGCGQINRKKATAAAATMLIVVGSATRYSFGDHEPPPSDYAWYSKNAEGKTHPVGKKRPNDWYLYDMHGNVWEWVQDWFGDYSKEPQHNPSGPEQGSVRVVCGGGWGSVAGRCRSAARSGFAPGFRIRALGFRLARRV
jgi:formylglycine-generating enzyme required for sulfatase activity